MRWSCLSSFLLSTFRVVLVVRTIHVFSWSLLSSKLWKFLVLILFGIVMTSCRHFNSIFLSFWSKTNFTFTFLRFSLILFNLLERKQRNPGLLNSLKLLLRFSIIALFSFSYLRKVSISTLDAWVDVHNWVFSTYWLSLHQFILDQQVVITTIPCGLGFFLTIDCLTWILI